MDTTFEAPDVNTGPTNIYGGDNDWGDDDVEVSSYEELTAELDDEPDYTDDETDDAPTDEIEDAPAEDAPVADAEDAPAEDDASADDEPAEEDAPAEDEPTDKKAPRVPLSRLNKEIEKRRAAEERLRVLEASAVAPAPAAPRAPTTPIVDKDRFQLMQDAMLDGRTEVAMEHFTAFLATHGERVAEDTRLAATAEVRSEIQATRAQEALIARAEVLAAQYPELDHTSENADIGLIEEVVALRDVYAERGMAPADALTRAVKLVALDNGLEDRSAPPAKPQAPRVKPVDVPKKLVQASKERGKLPGDSSRNRDAEINVLKLSDKEFAALSKEALARARGDFL